MKRRPLIPLAIAAALFTSACGAGEPQNEAIRESSMLALWPLSTQSEEARQEFTDGVQELDMRRLEEAYEHFKRALAADPNFAVAEAYAAWAGAEVGTVEGAYAHVQRAVALSSHASATEKLIIEIMQKGFAGDDEGAVAAAQKLVKADPQSARAHEQLAFAQQALQQHIEARAAREKAMQLAPALASLYLDQSASYIGSEPRDLTKAEQLARKAVELQPNDAEVYDVLGDALRAAGKLEDAAQAYTRGAELDPTDGNQLQQRGHVNTFLGRFSEARADYDAAVALETGNRKPTLAMYRTFVHLHEGNPKGAIDELERLYNSIDGMNVNDPAGVKLWLLEQSLIIPVYHHLVPETERAVQRYAQLRREFDKKVGTAEYRHQSDALIAFNEGLLAYAKRDWAGAKRKAAEYMKIREPDRNTAKNRRAHDLLGMVAYKEARYADALREFEQGSPDFIAGVFYKGLALEQLGRNAEAQQIFEKVATYYLNAPPLAVVRNEALAKVKKAAS